MTEPVYPRPRGNSMASASQIMGIISAICIVFFFLPGSMLLGLVLGCMAILFAHLSKGSGEHFPTQAKVGLGTSIFSLCVFCLLLLMSLAGLYMLVQMFGWETVLDPDALMEAMDWKRASSVFSIRCTGISLFGNGDFCFTHSVISRTPLS